MSTPIVRAGVAEYVAAVRSHLDDLSVEEVDELTGGLEADLDDALDDALAAGRSPHEQFGSPASYAAELRAAAGLPPRADQGGRRGAVARSRARWDRLADRVTSHRRWPEVRDFLVEIRPAWWVARAVIATFLIADVVRPGSFATFWVLVAAVLVSVQLGRRVRAGCTVWWRTGVRAGNVLAVLLLPVVWTALMPSPFGGGQEIVSVPAADGVWLDGAEVRNIFPYDEQGRPLSGVQLYDENGRPLQVGDSARTPVDVNGTVVGQVPAVDGAGQQHWNVYPLRQQGQVYGDSGELRPDADGPRAATAPPVTPAPLLVGGSSPAPTTAPAPSAGASQSPSQSPSAAPSATPTPPSTPVSTPIPTASTR